jgi:hemerythrin-like metal-binding protein
MKNKLMNNEHLDFLHFGVKSIDLQHQKFLQLLNELRTYNSSLDDNDTLKDLIVELKAYTIYHFETEKRIMEKSNFPEIEEHLNQHELFMQKIEEFKVTLNYENKTLSKQMLDFLQKWFLNHIPEYDRLYIDHIKQNRTKKS